MISFTEQLRRLDDAELTPHQFRLVMHYWRVGRCWESIRTTARKCGMSTGMVSQTRQWLLDNGWLSLEPGMVRGKARLLIALTLSPEPTAPMGRSPDEVCSAPEQNGCSGSPDERPRSLPEQKPVAVVQQVNALLNEPSDLNGPLEEREKRRPREGVGDEPDWQIAWNAAQGIMAFWCELVGEVMPHTDAQRRQRVSSHYVPITLLWQRLGEDSAETKRRLKAKYEEMLRVKLRPRRPAAVVPQIIGDLNAAKLGAASDGRSPPVSADEAERLNRRLNAHLNGRG